MAKSCTIVPTVKVNGEEKDSNLFKSLLKYTGDRNVTKTLWALAQSREFLDTLDGIELDENGEPTIESYAKAVGLESMTETGLTVQGVKQQLDAEDKGGMPKVHKNAREKIREAIEANRKNRKVVADVHSVKGGVTVSVEERTVENADVPGKLAFRHELSNRLLNLLKSVGFDIDYIGDEDLSWAAMFSPENAETTAEGLKTVIRIARGEEGENAFPEEFAHLLIEGLHADPRVQRLMASLGSDAAVEAILGSDYQTYVDAYDGNRELLRKEAAGQLLAEYIQGKASPVDRTPILSRIWEFIKSLVAGTTEGRIDTLINDAREAAQEIADDIKTNDDIFEGLDSDAVMQSKTLYATKKKVNGLRALLEKQIEVASRRMKLLATRTPDGKYNTYMMENLASIKKHLANKRYTMGTVEFLQNTLEEAQAIIDKLESSGIRNITSDSSELEIVRASKFLRQMKEFGDGYAPIIDALISIEDAIAEGEIKGISDEDARKISDTAAEVAKSMKSIARSYKKLRYNTVFSFLKNYWGEDKIISMGKGKTETLTLKGVLELARKDITFADSLINSMSDASDPLLSLIDKVVKDTQTKRDEELQGILSKVRTLHAKLTKAGHNTDFMYEKDENGKLTGMIVSPYDFAKFNADRKAFIEELKTKGLTWNEMQDKISQWENTHMKDDEPDPMTGKVRRVPKGYDKPLPVMTDAQKEFYDNMITLKRALDAMIPDRFANLYRAVQIRNNATEAIANNITNPKQALKLLKDNLKDSFLRRSDDTAFGMDSKKVQLDFAGNPIDRIPVFYTSPIEDVERLSTDFTSSMMAYAAMAVNYRDMNKIVDTMELARDLIHEREVQQWNGKNKLEESMKVLGTVFTKAYTKKGNKTRMSQRVDDYYDTVIYGRRKQDQGTIGDSNIDVAKTGDAIKNYTGLVGLGLNLFAGISNVVQGKLQMFFEGVGSEFFNLKDLAVSKKQYYEMLPEFLAEINTVNKKGKLSLLADKFNAMEDFYNNLQNTDYYKSGVARIIGNTNWFILNNIGEHYLHCRNMLAILNHKKVMDGDTEISLEEAFEVYTDEQGTHTLRLKEGIKDSNGNLISTTGLERGTPEFEEANANYLEMLKNTRREIGKISQSMNGAFNDDDKGAIHRNVLGRMAMQFRQWMPAHFSRRYAGRYYDAALDQEREGFYRTFGKFMWDTMCDLAHAKIRIGENWNSLDVHQKANVKRAISELLVWACLALLIRLGGSEKDKKTWSGRMLAYQLKRAQLETGASVPWFSAFDNMKTIVKSPAASVNTVSNLVDLFKFHNIFNEVESGRYKGWSRYAVDFSQAMPLYGQIRRTMDLKDPNANYMFSVLNQ